MRHQGIFLQSSLWEPGWVPEGKTHKRVSDSRRLGTQELLTLKLHHIQPLSNLSLLFKCSYQLVAPATSASYKLILAVILCIHLSYQFWGMWFALWSQFSAESKKSHWFFYLTDLFLVVRMGQWLSSSLHLVAETRSFHKLYINFTWIYSCYQFAAILFLVPLGKAGLFLKLTCSTKTDAVYKQWCT